MVQRVPRGWFLALMLALAAAIGLVAGPPAAGQPLRLLAWPVMGLGVALAQRYFAGVRAGRQAVLAVSWFCCVGLFALVAALAARH